MKNLAGVLISPAMRAFCRPTGQPQSDKYFRVSSSFKSWPGGGGGGGASDDFSGLITRLRSGSSDIL